MKYPSERLRLAGAAAFCLALLAVTGPVSAQETYPSRPIRIVVPFGAGGITDVVARMVGQRLGDELKQQVVIENKPGAGGNIAAQTVTQSAADGYTLLLGTVGTQVVNQLIYPKLSYDPAALVPISLVGNAPFVLAASKAEKIDDLAGLVAYARSHPGRLNYGSAGHGSSPHLGIELLKSLTGIDIVHVPFKSGADAVNAAIGGQVQVVLDAIPVVMPQAKDGRLTALAIAQPKRSPAAPDVPTSAEAAVPGLLIGSWSALMAPAGTPPDRVDRLVRALTTVLSNTETLDRLAALGIEPLPTGPAAYAARVADELGRWSPVVKSAAIRVQ